MAAAQIYCGYEKFEFCKFQDKCKLLHSIKNCDKTDCDISNCNFRHPRQCKYFKIYKRCKFSTYCKYKHETSDIPEAISKKKIESLENEIASLKLFVEESFSKILSLEKKLEEKEDLKCVNNSPDDSLEVKNSLEKSLLETESLGNKLQYQQEAVIEMMESTTNIMAENIGEFEKEMNAKIGKIDDLENKLEEKSEMINDMKETLDYCNEKFMRILLCQSALINIVKSV